MVSLTFPSLICLRAARLFLASLLCALVLSPGATATAAPPGAVSLESVLRDVAASNPTLAARRSMAEAASDRRRSAGAWESPMIEVGVVNLPTSGRFDEDEMTMKMVGVSQRVPLFGAKGLRRRAAGEEANAAGAASARAQFDLYGEAVAAYADAYYALESVGEAIRHESGIRRFAEAARARYRAGNGRLEEILRAEAEGARVRADVVRFQSDAEVALARLDALRAQDAQGAPPTLAAPPSFVVPADPASWIAAATEGHPRVREAEARARSYGFSARADRRAVWPDLEVRASYGQRGRDAMGMELDDMVSATVAFTLPIFSGSREGAMANEMDAMARVASAERAEASLDLTREARTLHAEATAASRMVALLADTVVVTQSKALEASWSAFTAGTTDLYRVLDLSHALYAEDLELLEARRTLARAQGALIALTGRGDLAGVDLPAIGRDGR